MSKLIALIAKLKSLCYRIFRLSKVRKGNFVTEEVVFDKSFIDALPALQIYSNPGVVMLCRYLHPFREKVELWFSRLTPTEKKDMRERLRSLDEWVYMPALYELYIHEYCWSKKWQVTKNPDVNGRTPDYLVDAQGKASIYLEVASVFQPPEMLRQQKEANGLLDKLNSMEVPFAIAVQLGSWPTGQISPAKIARNVEHKLKLAIAAGAAESVTIDLSEYGLEGTLLAKHSPGAPKALAMFNSPVGCGLPSLPTMLAAIKKKINRYKNLDRPFVIGICSTDLFPLNQHTLESVLYGQKLTVVDMQSGAAFMSRDQSGLLPPKPGSDRPFNTRVSAVLYAETERRNDDLEIELKLFHNPWAQYSLSEEVFADIPQLIKVQSDSEQTRLQWTIEPVSLWKPIAV